jgi:5-methylcytosine-specific restriction endonuclease McrA
MGYTGKKKRDYQLAFVNKRKADWIKSKGGKCVKCGSTSSLEVDHKDQGNKTFNPRDIWSRSEEVRKRELKNCQVMCESCHEKKTALQNSKTGEASIIACGTPEKFEFGCRCFECREDHVFSWRESKKSDTI